MPFSIYGDDHMIFSFDPLICKIMVIISVFVEYKTHLSKMCLSFTVLLDSVC